MEHHRQTATEHLISALNGIFTHHILLASTASSLQWQPPSVTQTLQQLSLNQSAIHHELRDHDKRKDLCRALYTIFTCIEHITKHIATLEKKVIPIAKKAHSAPGDSELQRNLYHALDTKLHQIRTATFVSQQENFSPQWQIMQIRRAITRLLDERDLQDQLCSNQKTTENIFPANLQQLSRQIVHTQVTLKSLIQQQSNLLFENVFDLDQTPLHLDDYLIANHAQHPLIITVGIRSERPHTLHTGWLRAFAQHREKIKITFKKHEMRLQHLTDDETEHAKLITLLCQSELFRLLLKNSTRKIDRAIIEVDALCDRLNALGAEHLHDTPSHFFAQCAQLSQDANKVHCFMTQALSQMRMLLNTTPPTLAACSHAQSLATEA